MGINSVAILFALSHLAERTRVLFRCANCIDHGYRISLSGSEMRSFDPGALFYFYIICVVRNPEGRAFSHFLFLNKIRKTPLNIDLSQAAIHHIDARKQPHITSNASSKPRLGVVKSRSLSSVAGLLSIRDDSWLTAQDTYFWHVSCVEWG
jgi:hypothetical protein